MLSILSIHVKFVISACKLPEQMWAVLRLHSEAIFITRFAEI
jgi:hypothetical protein